MAISRYRIGSLGELEEGQSRNFQFIHQGEEIEAFLVNFEGDLFAYRNRCVHTPMRLDGSDAGRLFDGDGRKLRCQSHGAIFRPDTGECVTGPPGCSGKHLSFLALAVEGDDLYVVMHDKPASDPQAAPDKAGTR